MKNICVFAGASSGLKPAYAEAAHDLGRLIAKLSDLALFMAAGETD